MSAATWSDPASTPARVDPRGLASAARRLAARRIRAWSLDRGEAGLPWARLAILGEHNPYGGGETDALLPWPRGASGSRLVAILGLGGDLPAYLATSRRNLYPPHEDPRAAPSRAREAAIGARLAGPLVAHVAAGGVVALLGTRVRASALAASLRPPGRGVGVHPAVRVAPIGRGWVVDAPHPSGRCAAWQDRALPAAVRGTIRALLAGDPVVASCLRYLAEEP